MGIENYSHAVHNDSHAGTTSHTVFAYKERFPQDLIVSARKGLLSLSPRAEAPVLSAVPLLVSSQVPPNRRARRSVGVGTP